MKKLLKKLRDWLIVKLGGVTRENAESILEYWDKDVHKLAILTEKNASLEQTNNSLIGENNRLKTELDRDPPAWKTLGDIEVLVPRTLQAEWRYRQDPEAAVDMDKIAKERATLQILDGVRQYIHYSYDHDFFGDSRIRATLRILEGTGEAE